MRKQNILRVCHKFLINNDGYDLDIQDLCSSTSKEYENYVITYINTPLNSYIKRNNLLKKGEFYYHKKSKAYIYPINYELFNNNYLRDLYVMYNFRIFLSSFKKVFSLINPYIIHIQGTLLPQFLYAALYSRKQCKVFVTNHIGLINQELVGQKLGILLLKYLIHNILPFFCTSVISVSNHSRNSFHFYKKNVIVINPVPKIPKNKKAEFKEVLAENTLENNFCINKKDKVFCCIGRFSSQKNQLNVIKSFNTILKKDKNYKLILIGKANVHSQYYREIRKEINIYPDSYCLIDEIENRKVINVIENSDYLIAASYNEGFGRNAMEALLLGKPVIVSKRAGYEDFVENGGNGLFVDPDNIKEIASSIKRIKNFIVKNKHSHKVYIDEMMKVYQDG